jgi:predicted CXXCH cytochrome family protein
MNKIIFSLISMFCVANSYSQSITTTKHNLSISGPGTVKASSESEICKFCHAPHNTSPQTPLWNHTNSGATYTLYSSSTLNAIPGQPDGSSILCMACHDGTVALGSIISGPAISFAGGVTVMPAGTKNLATDLSNDHPISFLYNAALATADGQLITPAGITPPVHLENSKVQCASCHDSHANLTSSFLLSTSQASALCLSCHNRTYWTASTHKTSTSTWNGTGTSPWLHTPYTTVANNACENCHNPHNAGGNRRLLNYAPEENNCLNCHSGTVATATKNIQTQLAKTYKHNVAGYLGVHDPIENANIVTKHVECADCHNPHATNATTATAPLANGFEIGVSGINQAGTNVAAVTNAYEICYKCHSGQPWAPTSAVVRLINSNNTRLDFATTNVSFHPVVGARNNAEVVPNLIAPNTAATVLYCTACHSSDGAGVPAGPHGSTFPQILKLQYSTTYPTTESATVYALCYSCHNRTNLRAGTNSFKEHSKHLGANIPCSECHDPHGIPSPGTATNNSNLINFKASVVTAASGGQGPRFEDLGVRTGRCYLTCHGQDHNPKTY